MSGSGLVVLNSSGHIVWRDMQNKEMLKSILSGSVRSGEVLHAKAA